MLSAHVSSLCLTWSCAVLSWYRVPRASRSGHASGRPNQAPDDTGRHPTVRRAGEAARVSEAALPTNLSQGRCRRCPCAAHCACFPDRSLHTYSETCYTSTPLIVCRTVDGLPSSFCCLADICTPCFASRSKSTLAYIGHLHIQSRSRRPCCHTVLSWAASIKPEHPDQGGPRRRAMSSLSSWAAQLSSRPRQQRPSGSRILRTPEGSRAGLNRPVTTVQTCGT